MRWASGGQGTNSDENGEYLIDSIAAGQQTIYFFKQGFLRTQKRVDITSGKEARLDVELDRGRELHGRVADKSGQPIAGANVSAIPAFGGIGGFPWKTSDNDGNFRSRLSRTAATRFRWSRKDTRPRASMMSSFQRKRR